MKKYTRDEIYRNRLIVLVITLLLSMILYVSITSTVNYVILKHMSDKIIHESTSAIKDISIDVHVPEPKVVIEKQTIMQINDYQIMQVPHIDSSFKAYMDYRTITNMSSDQWKLQKLAHTDTSGIRMIDNMYMVAVGTYYADRCGVILDITFDSGKTIKCIVGDIKDDRHTDTLKQHSNGNIVEFIVDDDVISRAVKVSGDISTTGIYGNVSQIKKYNEMYSY